MRAHLLADKFHCKLGIIIARRVRRVTCWPGIPVIAPSTTVQQVPGCDHFCWFFMLGLCGGMSGGKKLGANLLIITHTTVVTAGEKLRQSCLSELNFLSALRFPNIYCEMKRVITKTTMWQLKSAVVLLLSQQRDLCPGSKQPLVPLALFRRRPVKTSHLSCR